MQPPSLLQHILFAYDVRAYKRETRRRLYRWKGIRKGRSEEKRRVEEESIVAGGIFRRWRRNRSSQESILHVISSPEQDHQYSFSFVFSCNQISESITATEQSPWQAHRPCRRSSARFHPCLRGYGFDSCIKGS
ncbi:hypothetical protein L1987_44168 [Smallanthus sonchifolius]|uniref:Uncharacterized protein n=1 Tax=Smallanthus sonchifolius TaxID=185202 RepID=A0ACB9GNU4_9ASTR|nr:hypothetical protein L1987_44168 [Smallanthus sonchifolius]